MVPGELRSGEFAGELLLRLQQGLRLDEETLPFITAPAPAETHDHGVPRAFRLDPAREQCVPGREELEIGKTGACQARRTGFLHDEKLSGAAAPVAFPLIVQWLDHH